MYLCCVVHFNGSSVCIEKSDLKLTINSHQTKYKMYINIFTSDSAYNFYFICIVNLTIVRKYYQETQDDTNMN